MLANGKPNFCENCPLVNSPGPVWGAGNRKTAKIVYIGQNPGLQEIRYSHPFVGPSGRVRNRQLVQAGIRLDEIYETNQVKCLTPDNRPPTDHEIRCCKRIVDAELADAKADVVVLAGATAFSANIGSYSTLSPFYSPSTSIMNRMGCVELRDGKKWIGTVHPALIMRMPDWQEAAVEHLKKAWSLVGVDVPRPEVVEHVTNEFILDYIVPEALKVGEFAYDVETTDSIEVEEDDYIGSDRLMTMCGISFEQYKAYVLDPEQVNYLEPLFASGSWAYAHNQEFDKYHVQKEVAAQKWRVQEMDTMQATHFLYSYAPKKLKPFCVSMYTNLPYYNRDLGKINKRLYNGMDCIATLQAAREEKRQHEKWGTTKVFFDFGQKVLPILEEQRRIGCNIDLKKALLLRTVIQQRLAKGEVLIAKLAGPLFNWNSPKQVMELLYTTWQLPKQYNGKKHEQKLTGDQEARKRLRTWLRKPEAEIYRRSLGIDPKIHQAATILLDLLDFCGGEKKKLEYFDRISPDGRIHAFYKAHGTWSLRFSSTPNLQNFSDRDVGGWGGSRRGERDTTDPTGGEQLALGSLRSIVIPDDPDRDSLLTCDFEQMQLWIYATIFNVKWLLDVYESREYIYGVVYEKLYKEPFFLEGKPKTKAFKHPGVLKDRLLRAKAVPLGFTFGRSGESVADEYMWPVSEGNQLQRWWFGLNPEIPASFDKVKYLISQKTWIRHIFGQVLHYPSGMLTDAVNSHAQSNEAMVVRETMILIDEEFKRRKYPNTRIVLSVHDSLTFNIPDDLVEEVYEQSICPILTRPIPQLKGFRFRHSADIGKCWSWKNESLSEWRARRSGLNCSASSGGQPVQPGVSSSPQDLRVDSL